MSNVWPDIPWLYVRPRQPEDDPPGFRVTAETPRGIRPDAFPAVAPWRTLLPAPGDTSFGSTAGGVGGWSNPFDLYGRLAPDASVVPSNALPATPLSPDTPNPQPWQLDLQGFGQFQSDADVPGFRVKDPDPPGFRIVPSVPEGDAPREEFGFAAFRPDPDVDAASADTAASRGMVPPEALYPPSSPTYDSLFPEPPPDRVQEALDEIARIYGIRRVQSTDLFNPSTPGTGSVRANGEVGGYAPSTISDAFDPRYILPAQAPGGGSRPPPRIPSGRTPGPGDNLGPPLGRVPPSPASPTPPPTSPSAKGPQLPRSPGGAEPPPNQAGPAAAAEQRPETPLPPPTNPRVDAVWDKIAKVINEDAPDPNMTSQMARKQAQGYSSIDACRNQQLVGRIILHPGTYAAATLGN